MKRFLVGIALALSLGACGGEEGDSVDNGHPERVPEDYVSASALAAAETDIQRDCMLITMTSVRRSYECRADGAITDREVNRLEQSCLEADEGDLAALDPKRGCIELWATAPCSELESVGRDDDPCTIITVEE